MGGEKRAWYTLLAHATSSLANFHTTPLHEKFCLVTFILLRYTKLNKKFCLSAKRPQCRVILLVRHVQAVLKSETISC